MCLIPDNIAHIGMPGTTKKASPDQHSHPIGETLGNWKSMQHAMHINCDIGIVWDASNKMRSKMENPVKASD